MGLSFDAAEAVFSGVFVLSPSPDLATLGPMTRDDLFATPAAHGAVTPPAAEDAPTAGYAPAPLAARMRPRVLDEYAGQSLDNLHRAKFWRPVASSKRSRS